MSWVILTTSPNVLPGPGLVEQMELIKKIMKNHLTPASTEGNKEYREMQSDGLPSQMQTARSNISFPSYQTNRMIHGPPTKINMQKEKVFKSLLQVRVTLKPYHLLCLTTHGDVHDVWSKTVWKENIISGCLTRGVAMGPPNQSTATPTSQQLLRALIMPLPTVWTLLPTQHTQMPTAVWHPYYNTTVSDRVHFIAAPRLRIWAVFNGRLCVWGSAQFLLVRTHAALAGLGPPATFTSPQHTTKPHSLGIGVNRCFPIACQNLLDRLERLHELPPGTVLESVPLQSCTTHSLVFCFPSFSSPPHFSGYHYRQWQILYFLILPEHTSNQAQEEKTSVKVNK